MNERIATRSVFFIAGLATSAWAVMVPFAKLNTGANEALLGILLLCLGGRCYYINAISRTTFIPLWLQENYRLCGDDYYIIYAVFNISQ